MGTRPAVFSQRSFWHAGAEGPFSARPLWSRPTTPPFCPPPFWSIPPRSASRRRPKWSIGASSGGGERPIRPFCASEGRENQRKRPFRGERPLTHPPNRSNRGIDRVQTALRGFPSTCGGDDTGPRTVLAVAHRAGRNRQQRPPPPHAAKRMPGLLEDCLRKNPMSHHRASKQARRESGSDVRHQTPEIVLHFIEYARRAIAQHDPMGIRASPC